MSTLDEALQALLVRVLQFIPNLIVALLTFVATLLVAGPAAQSTHEREMIAVLLSLYTLLAKDEPLEQAVKLAADAGFDAGRRLPHTAALVGARHDAGERVVRRDPVR